MMLLALVLNPIAILITLLIFCVVVWAVRALMAAFGIGEPIATVVYVILVLIFLLYLLNALGGYGPTVRIG